MIPSRLSAAQVHAALDATVAITCALSLLIAGLLARRPAQRAAPGKTPPSSGAGQPWAAFLLVCALLLLNQLVVNAYIVRLHGGDPAFVARYLGAGWFVLAPTAPPVRWLVASLPSSWLGGPLAYSILRVQAALELPFALLAYFSVVAMLDGALYRWLVRSALVPLAAVSFTFTFCLIELRLHNPWTRGDLYARWLSAGLVLLYWGRRRRVSAKEAAELAAPRLGFVDLVIFFVGAAAVGAVVLILYDAALLYNLGHLPAELPILAASVTLGSVATLARAKSGRAKSIPPGAGLQGLTAVLGAFAAVFFAPALSIRYCGARASALVGAGTLLVAAMLLGIRIAARALDERGIPRWRALLGLAVAMATAGLLLVGNVAAWIFGDRQALSELVLLQNAALIFPTAALGVWLLDGLLGRVGTRGRIRG